MSKVVTPYSKESGKKEQVEEMFDNIAGRYDMLNRLLSFGIDRRWRKKAIKVLVEDKPEIMLDVATGTGDFALDALKLDPVRIDGLDLSAEMIAIGRKKIAKKGLQDKIHFHKGDSENIPFESNTYDAATVSFGVRNFEDLPKGLREIGRVLKPGKKLVVLEFSKPKGWFFKTIFSFYFKRILPTIGRWFSGDKRAYTYLPESVDAFPYGQEFLDIFKEAGFENLGFKPLMTGVCTVYWGEKSY